MIKSGKIFNEDGSIVAAYWDAEDNVVEIRTFDEIPVIRMSFNDFREVVKHLIPLTQEKYLIKQKNNVKK